MPWRVEDARGEEELVGDPARDLEQGARQRGVVLGPVAAVASVVGVAEDCEPSADPGQ